MPQPQSEGDADLLIRPATEADLGAINDIYNYYVLHSTATYQEEPEPIDARRAWLQRRGPSHPVTVAEVGERVVGWGSLSPFHARSAYRMTVENSVYLRPDHLRRGIGTLLLRDLVARAKALGHHTIIAGVDAAQPASVALHARVGFVQVALLKEVGFKFGRWCDVVYMQLVL
jgi:L-amino acid N-acyltransferase YncA